MSKTNKELAIDVAIATIQANPRCTKGPNDSTIVNSINLESICNIIEQVSYTLDKIDQRSK